VRSYYPEEDVEDREEEREGADIVKGFPGFLVVKRLSGPHTIHSDTPY
jgi:hypothetical protein